MFGSLATVPCACKPREARLEIAEQHFGKRNSTAHRMSLVTFRLDFPVPVLVSVRYTKITHNIYIHIYIYIHTHEQYLMLSTCFKLILRQLVTAPVCVATL